MCWRMIMFFFWLLIFKVKYVLVIFLFIKIKWLIKFFVIVYFVVIVLDNFKIFFKLCKIIFVYNSDVLILGYFLVIVLFRCNIEIVW